MARKSKRQTRRSTVSATQTAESSIGSSRFTDRDFNPDYTYVIKDLKRIGILASSFFVILIILSFFLG